VLFAVMTGFGAAAQAGECIVAPAAGHASLKALPDTYWRSVNAWADLPALDRDFLVRTAIAQRNLRSKGDHGTFNAVVPKKLAAVPGFPGKLFVTKGAPQLGKMVEDLRKYLKVADPEGTIGMGDTFRSYEIQLANWPVNLKNYFRQYRGQLKPEPKTGRFTDDDVCNFRKFAANRFAFPGYSRHQSGNAVDFKTRVGKDGPELGASTSPAKIGKTGKSNTRLWCTAPAYVWLSANARKYGFVQARIDEPWHWEYDPKAAADPDRANYVAPTCRAPAMEPEAKTPAKTRKTTKKKR
jgi:hypothetical protein